MTTPFNPFGGGRGQRGGATGAPPTSNRGRGGAFVPRGSRGSHRGARSRGQRGRGRGRGAGAATFVASDSETSGADKPSFPPSKSPFAPINKQQSAPAGFGAQRSQTSSPFQRPASGSGFGSSGSSVASGGSGQEHANDIEMSAGNWHGIPVEDASTMARYGQRFEKVSVKPFGEATSQMNSVSDQAYSSSMTAQRRENGRSRADKWPIPINP